MKQCSQPGCPNLTAGGGPCKECRPKVEANTPKKKTLAFYGCSAWKGARERYRAAHPLCELGDADGFTEPATLVDHVYEIEDGGKKLDRMNFMSQCRPCHIRKTAEMARRRKQGIDAVMTYVHELNSKRGRAGQITGS